MYIIITINSLELNCACFCHVVGIIRELFSFPKQSEIKLHWYLRGVTSGFVVCYMSEKSMKRYLAVLGSGMFCVVCLSLYLMLETATNMNGSVAGMGEVCMLP